jgi:hypothetical protein
MSGLVRRSVRLTRGETLGTDLFVYRTRSAKGFSGDEKVQTIDLPPLVPCSLCRHVLGEDSIQLLAEQYGLTAKRV